MKILLSLSAVILIVAAAGLKACQYGSITATINRHDRPAAWFEIPSILLILVVGLSARTVLFGNIPGGVYVDEASTGYDTFAILHYGIDRNGFHNPLQLASWGSGQYALAAYASMPFIAILGLNPVSIRLASLLAGILSLGLFYFLVRRTDNNVVALTALFFLAICPWHIMVSRWGIDSNLFPFVFLLATVVVIMTLDHDWWFVPAMAVYGLTYYSYGTTYFMVPLFILTVVAVLMVYKKIRIRVLFVGLGVHLLVALPIIVYVLINTFPALGMGSIQTAWFSIPKLPGEARYFQVFSWFLHPEFFETLGENLAAFTHLMILQNDGLIWNAIPRYGTLYLFSLPLIVTGGIILVKDQIGHKKPQRNAVFLAWLISAIFLGMTMQVNIIRINIIFIPLVYLIARGFLFVFQQIKALGFLLLMLYLGWFGLFENEYFTTYPEQIDAPFYDSLGEAIDYAEAETKGSVSISISQTFMPYIYVLFYEQVDPHEFLESVIYSDPTDAFRHVASFGRYRFIEASSMLPGSGAYVLENSELFPLDRTAYHIQHFEHYSVFIPHGN